MFSYSVLLLAFPGVLVFLCGSCIEKPNWEFELLIVEHWSSNESLLNSSLVRKGINRTFSVVDGEIDWKFDADISTTFELRIFRNYLYPGMFILEPYAIPRQPLFEFLSSPVYQKTLYPTFAHCTNFPKVKGLFKPPLEQQTFKVDNCHPNIETLPPIFKPNFQYEVEFLFDGQVKADFTLNFKAAKK